MVPWLCTLLARETYSPECQKAALQALQLLGLCGGAPLAQMERLLGASALDLVASAQDATSAALAVTPEVLATLAPQIDAFLVVHRRSLKPEPLQVSATVREALASAAPAATGDDAVAADTAAAMEGVEGGDAPAAEGARPQRRRGAAGAGMTLCERYPGNNGACSERALGAAVSTVLQSILYTTSIKTK